jgi:nucleoside phosphorylase
LLAFVAAERREFDGMLRKADRVAKLDWPLSFGQMAWFKGVPSVLVAEGPGRKLAGRAVEMLGKVQDLKGLVSIGFCGALNKDFAPCDIFVATEMVGLPNAISVPRSHFRFHAGKLLSIDRVVCSVAEKADLRRTGADAVEMEAAAVMEKAAEWKIPFYCIRVITDTAAENLPLDFNLMRDTGGRFSYSKIFAAALRRPGSVFPELLKLNQRCKDASEALGEFLVDVSF